MEGTSGNTRTVYYSQVVYNQLLMNLRPKVTFVRIPTEGPGRGGRSLEDVSMCQGRPSSVSDLSTT